MYDATQIAFQLDNESLRQIDELAAAKSWSRAEVLRVAVNELLATRRESATEEEAHDASRSGSDPASTARATPSAISAAGPTSTLGMIRCSRSIAATGTSSVTKTRGRIASVPTPKRTTHSAYSTAVTASTTG